jgi:FAD/FMN-containing dehydrogenase
VRDARAIAESAGGSLVIMAGPDSLRREVGAWGSAPPTLELMMRLKHAFDPQRTLNPGRFVV